MNDAPIVRDTRKVRSAISHQFGNSVEKYVASLRAPRRRVKPSALSRVREEHSQYSTPR